MRGRASACGSATVINALSTGKGGAFAVELRVEAEVELIEGGKGVKGEVRGARESPSLVERCVRKVLEREGLWGEYGARVKTTAGVPIAVGLSSSSAASNAAVLATFDALGKKPRAREVLELAIQASLEEGVTLTGAFDDAAASYLGGGVLTDNLRRRILRRFEVDPELEVLVHLPPHKLYTSQVRRETLRPIVGMVEQLHRQALLGNIWGAMTVNGLLYAQVLGHDPSVALEALSLGALAAGLTGKGPATVAVCEPSKTRRIREAWERREGRVLLTRPSSEGARVG
ncbi:MAG: shikimate kinase [Candidatus Hadarchaeales archaeon]